ncbi:hypothetical protein Q0A17_22575 [Citrobacter sp. S2-9]|uniref:Uncharacterized protein n=1 Tax=Citrobacter enshiensis TaxID=2971264 RepID=A0ABT8Q1M0_9ENTR|nr:hypothetical protein [Citrobacter enshiensis]MDN8602163.1 hypothetical protein [Citrobacter enshiensis]
MRNKILIVTIFIAMCFYSSLSFSKNTNSTVSDNDYHSILEIPQDLQDFFEMADACESWVSFFDSRLDEITYHFVVGSVKDNCSNIESKLTTMKNKYKNNKDYSERLTVYDDTVFIYKEYEIKKNGVEEKLHESKTDSSK